MEPVIDDMVSSPCRWITLQRRCCSAWVPSATYRRFLSLYG